MWNKMNDLFLGEIMLMVRMLEQRFCLFTLMHKWRRRNLQFGEFFIPQAIHTNVWRRNPVGHFWTCAWLFVWTVKGDGLFVWNSREFFSQSLAPVWLGRVLSIHSNNCMVTIIILSKQELNTWTWLTWIWWEKPWHLAFL